MTEPSQKTTLEVDDQVELHPLASEVGVQVELDPLASPSKELFQDSLLKAAKVQLVQLDRQRPQDWPLSPQAHKSPLLPPPAPTTPATRCSG